MKDTKSVCNRRAFVKEHSKKQLFYADAVMVANENASNAAMIVNKLHAFISAAQNSCTSLLWQTDEEDSNTSSAANASPKAKHWQSSFFVLVSSVEQ